VLLDRAEPALWLNAAERANSSNKAYEKLASFRHWSLYQVIGLLVPVLPLHFCFCENFLAFHSHHK
jgi:hypothetical protein